MAAITATDVKKGASNVGKFASVGGGLVAGTLVLSKIPSLDFLMKVPVVGDYLSKLAPGTLTMVLAYLASDRFDNEYVKSASMGMGWAGVLDTLKRTGLLDKINSFFPTGLSGLGIVQNNGAYAPDYFLKSNWAGSRMDGLAGLGANGNSLQGAASLQGASSLQGPATGKSLQGGIGCMYQ